MSERATLNVLPLTEHRLRFEAGFPRGTAVMESGKEAQAPNPVQHLMTAVAACMAVDVVTILRKKRLVVTGYTIDMQGERAPTPPQYFTSLTFTHHVRGQGIPREAVEQAIQLSSDTYCSVKHTLRPDVAIHNHIEITEG
ncbi:MAG: OsmC family protein [bacterium]